MSERASGAVGKAGLYQAKLKGLLTSLPDALASVKELTLVDAPGGAGGVLALDDGGVRGFCLLADDPKTGSQIRGLGLALLWADRFDVSELHVLAERADAGDLARRATCFNGNICVWEIQGVALVPASSNEVSMPPELTLAELEFSPVMVEAGTLPVDDHGRLVGEIDGLEVARVTVDDDGAFLEVGVGQADRELQMLVHGGLERVVALDRAVGLVLEHRRMNAPLHPLNRMARERWLRSEILKDPSLIGLQSAEPLAPLRPRSTLLGTEPCALLGSDAAGEAVLVVCSVGVDVDLAAEAADYRLRLEATGHSPGTKLLLVVPEPDQHPAVMRSVERLNRASFASFPTPWGAPL